MTTQEQLSYTLGKHAARLDHHERRITTLERKRHMPTIKLGDLMSYVLTAWLIYQVITEKVPVLDAVERLRSGGH